MTILALNRRIKPQPIMPTPALVDTARQAFDAKQAAKRDARAKSPVRRLARRLMMALSGLFLIVAFVGGTGVGSAQAFQMPWDTGANIAAGVLNFCNPEAVPDPSGVQGFDSVWLGLNKGGGADSAVKASSPEQALGDDGGFTRLQKMYADSSNKSQLTNVLNTGYSSYGVSTLRWTNYGASCMSEGSLLTGVSNLLLTALVVFPSSFAMAVVSFAMNNVLYTVFSAMVSPVIGLFASVFKPWLVVIAVMIGLPFAWIKSRGSLGKLLSATAWVAFILSVFFYVQNNSAGVFNFANNAVTNLTSFASCMMLNSDTDTSEANFSTIGKVSGGGCSTDIVSQVLHGTQASGNTFTEANGVSQAIWYTLPYTVWSMGEVGPDQAAADRVNESKQKVSWSAAILNGQYAGPDDGRMVRAINVWNNGNYNPTKDHDSGSKISYWTNSANADDWVTGKTSANGDAVHLATPAEEVPFLTVVRAMCGENYTGTTGGDRDGDDATKSTNNVWGYGGNCDTATAGTSHVWTSVQGNAFEQRISAAVAGGLVALIILAVLGFVSMYLIFQKLSFYFLMMFAPLFLAIGAFPDEKRSAFAKKFGEVLLANVIKQVVAVIMVIFIAKSLSTVLGNPTIPWLLKPVAVLAFYFALLFFAIPLTRILKAAAKGDTRVIDKVANAPKTALKVAAVAGAVAATAGIAAPVLAGTGALAGVGGVTGLAKGGLTALKAGGGRTAMTMMGRRGGALGTVARLANQGGRLGAQAVAHAKGEVTGNLRGVQALDQAEKAQRAMLMSRDGNLSKGKNLFDRDENGKLTKLGEQQAMNMWMRTKGGEARAEAKAVSDSKTMFFKEWKERTGNYHDGDPMHPENKSQAAAAAAAAASASATATAGAKGEPGKAGEATAPSFAGSNPTSEAEQAAERALGGVVNRPGFVSGDNAHTVRSGRDVEKQFGGRNQAADSIVNDSGDAFVETYGAKAERVDVTHPAGAAVVQQIWAKSTGDEDMIGVASLELADHVKAYGTPSVVVSPSSTVPVAEFDSNGLGNLVAAIPTIRDTDSLDDRLRGALAFAQVASTVPADHPMFGLIDKTRDAVLNPTSTASDVNHIAGVLGSGVNDYQSTIAEIARQAASEAAGQTAAAMAGAAAGVAGTVAVLGERAGSARTESSEPPRSSSSWSPDEPLAGARPTASTPGTEAPSAPSTPTASPAWGSPGGTPTWAPTPRETEGRRIAETPLWEPAPRHTAPAPAPTPQAPAPTSNSGPWGHGGKPSGVETERVVDAVKAALSDQRDASVDAVATAAERAVVEGGPDVDEAGSFRPGRKNRKGRRAARRSIYEQNEDEN